MKNAFISAAGIALAAVMGMPVTTATATDTSC